MAPPPPADTSQKKITTSTTQRTPGLASPTATNTSSPNKQPAQPKPGSLAKEQPQGQLAALMRHGEETTAPTAAAPTLPPGLLGTAIGKEVYSMGGSAAGPRSSSAPPAQDAALFIATQPGALHDPASVDPRSTAEYAAFFHSNARLDPRLPPPIYAPGQSWQVWSTPASSAAAGGATMNHLGQAAGPGLLGKDLWAPEPSSGGHTPKLGARFSANDSTSAVVGSGSPSLANRSPGSAIGDRSPKRAPRSSPSSPTKASSSSANAFPVSARANNLVDMIQNDFPRTPSPVFALQQLKLRQQEQLQQQYAHADPANAADALHDLMDSRITSRTPPPALLTGAVPPPRASSTPPVLHRKQLQQFQQSNISVSSPLQRELETSPATEEEMIASIRRMGLMEEGDSAVNAMSPSAPGSAASMRKYSPASAYRQTQSAHTSPVMPSASLGAGSIDSNSFQYASFGAPSPSNMYHTHSPQGQSSLNAVAGVWARDEMYAAVGNTGNRMSTGMPGSPSFTNMRASDPTANGRPLSSGGYYSPHPGTSSRPGSAGPMGYRGTHHPPAMNMMQHPQAMPQGGYYNMGGGMRPMYPGGASPQMKQHAHVGMMDPGAGLRSSLLEEFRNTKSRKFELRDILGHAVEFSGDQHGSRFIQQKLETTNLEEKQMIFEEILPNALQLMTDVFGNYVIQKFFEHGNMSQKMALAHQMEGHVLSLSLQMYGCRVVQKALEYVLVDQQARIIRELEGHVLKCVKDQNGNHVIQKAIERVPMEHIRFILDAFHGEIYGLATHPYGCRVMQRVFEHCDSALTQPLLDELHGYTHTLVQDQYGNYVIQHILEKGRPQDKQAVIQSVQGKILGLSRHKFASNVVEKCVAFADQPTRSLMIAEVLTMGPDGTQPLIHMVKDQFANYVVQKMLELATPVDREHLISQLQPHFGTLRKFTYGKHILAKIEKLAQMHVEGVSGMSGLYFD